MTAGLSVRTRALELLLRKWRNAGWVMFASLLWAAWFGSLGYLRFTSFHNETFDLAMYSRMAWGYAHANLWDPFVHAWVLGVHISPVLLPLGVLSWLGASLPVVLLFSQALVMASAAVPLALFAARRLGTPGAIMASVMWLLHPNLGHVASFEFHPGSLAVLPLAWAIDVLDRRAAKELGYAVIAVLLCREDFSLITALLGAFAWQTGARQHTEASQAFAATGKRITLYSLAYFAMFSLVLLPLFGPEDGSLHAHFGTWGNSLPEVALYLLMHPAELIGHLMQSDRLMYLPLLLLSVGGFFVVLRPVWLLFALPTLGINLLSVFPGTTDLDSHYLTPALPFLLAAALDGLGAAVHAARRLPDRASRTVQGAFFAAVAAPVLILFLSAGAVPVSSAFDPAAFVRDDISDFASEILARIPAKKSVQAPDLMLAHLVHRDRVHRGPPPDLWTDFIVLDVQHRMRFGSDGTVLRTAQEPIVRDWLSNPNYGVRAANAAFVLLERGQDPRTAAALAPYFLTHQRDEFSEEVLERASNRQSKLAQCLSVLEATLDARKLSLKLYAHGPCDADLGMRIGHRYRPKRVDLLCDGLLSPAHFRARDIIVSKHDLSPLERQTILQHGLRLGLVRSSGARPEPTDPDALDVPLRQIYR